jgi:hypothetical protein
MAMGCGGEVDCLCEKCCDMSHVNQILDGEEL